MLHTRRQNEFGTWYIPGRKPVISYSFAVMADLGDMAKKAAPDPVGGVLFGTSDDNEIRITAFRRIPTAAAAAGSGSNLFDEAGEAELNKLVNTYASEPDLTGLRPVGWYRSRTAEGIQLSEADVRIWNGFFSHLTQVTLVLRVDERQSEEPVRAGFFFRPRHGGSPRTDSSYRTFVVGPAAPESTGDVGRLAEAVIQSEPQEPGLREPEQQPMPERALQEPPPADDRDRAAATAADAAAPGSVGAQPAPAAPDPADSLEPPSDLFTPPSGSGKYRYVWTGTAIAALLVTAAGSYLAKRRITPSAVPAGQVGLRFSGPPNRLQLVWNAQSMLVRSAESGQLRIIDAESDRAELVTPDLLAKGRMPVVNRSGRIEARLRLIPRDTSASGATVVAQFIGPSSSDAQMREARGVSSLAPLIDELQSLRTSIQSAIDGNRGLTNRIAQVRNSLAARLKSLPPATLAPGSKLPLSTAGGGGAVASPVQPTPPASTTAQQQQPPQQQPQPAAAVPPSSAPSSPVIGAPGPSFGADRLPARSAPAPEPPPAPSYSGPASGKLIWSGFLAPGTTVTIDGRRASTGSVNSPLPGVPVRLTVYPAEFSAGGLVIYSAAPRHQSGNVTEARSAQNGWLSVRYVYDPARARDVQLAATPNSAGGFRQLQIRGGERPVSVAVIEWAVSQ